MFAYILLQVNSVYFAFIIRSQHCQDCVFHRMVEEIFRDLSCDKDSC